jgi:hypothetical protein
MNRSMVEAFLHMRDGIEEGELLVDAAYCLDANEALPAGSTVKARQPRRLIERGYPHWYTLTSASVRR